MGTRFHASPEALGHEQAKQQIVGAHAEETLRTRVFDIVRGDAWPVPYTGRAIATSSCSDGTAGKAT
jgi:nitronate monooxygenase